MIIKDLTKALKILDKSEYDIMELGEDKYAVSHPKVHGYFGFEPINELLFSLLNIDRNGFFFVDREGLSNAREKQEELKELLGLNLGHLIE